MFTKFKFTPETGFSDNEAYPTQPDSEEAAREQLQRPHEQTKSFINETLIAELTDSAGAEKIGASELFEGDVTEPNVMAKLRRLREELLNVMAGEMPDGSVTTEKLSKNIIFDGGEF